MFDDVCLFELIILIMMPRKESPSVRCVSAKDYTPVSNKVKFN